MRLLNFVPLTGGHVQIHVVERVQWLWWREREQVYTLTPNAGLIDAGGRLLAEGDPRRARLLEIAVGAFAERALDEFVGV